MMKKMLRMAAAVVMLALLAGPAAGTGEAQGKPVLVPVEMHGFFPPDVKGECFLCGVSVKRANLYPSENQNIC